MPIKRRFSMIHYMLRLCMILTVPALMAGDCEILQGIAALRKGLKQTQSQINQCCQNISQCCQNTGGITNCCQMLSNEISACCASINNNINNSTSEIINTINECCATLEELIGEISAAMPCGPIIPIFQSDIPLEIKQEGRYCLAEDIFFPGTPPSEGTLGDPNPGILGSFAIAVNSKNVDIYLNQHTMFHTGGSNASMIGIIGNSSHVSIHDGIIVGSGNIADEDCFGINALTSGVVINNVEMDDFAGLNSAGLVIQGYLLESPAAQSTVHFNQQGVLVNGCTFFENYAGITLGNFYQNVLVQSCSISDSLFAGINEPARQGYSSNIIIKDTAIANSVLNGIYTTFNQSNWLLQRVQIANSGLNGAIFSAFQTLNLDDVQVFNSGSYGITTSIRQCQNVTMNKVQIFNAGNGALRVDNTSNLLIKDSQFINYIPNSEPVVKIQDVYSGEITNCRITSAAGTSDALFFRNVHGFKAESNTINVLCNQPVANCTAGNNLSNCVPPPGVPNLNALVNCCPVGINLQGGITTTVVRNCVVSGNPAIGIAIQPDQLNGLNSGITIKDNTIQSAVLAGILVSQSSECQILGNEIIDTLTVPVAGTSPAQAGSGIFLDACTSNCAVRDNTLTNNAGFGIYNSGTNNQIYHNFASANGSQSNGVGTNYVGVSIVAQPAPNLGVLENISA